jgi:hypothetical protein
MGRRATDLTEAIAGLNVDIHCPAGEGTNPSAFGADREESKAGTARRSAKPVRYRMRDIWGQHDARFSPTRLFAHRRGPRPIQAELYYFSTRLL